MKNLINPERLNYLMVGFINTAFGYSAGVTLYLNLIENLNLIAISIISNILSITFSFLTYKIFVFKTRGNWLSEYIKCYVVYGSSSVLGIIMLWLLVEYSKINIWMAQALVIMSVILVSYLGHKNFTFKAKS